ncbi:hypothetical protein BGX26_009769 [Mortierella sp. AD094]|nr:hypothetical protein BGX26_009769 [Mortierella sp. AD094]
MSLLQHLVPELAPTNYTASSPTQKRQHRRGRTPFPVSPSSTPQVSILTPSSLHKYVTTYSPPVIFDTSSDLAETTATAISETISSVTTNTLFFPGTCHRSAYLVFLPDPTSDLAVNFGPLIDSTFKEFYDPDDDDPEDKELEDFLTIYLFEEDEIEMERRKHLKLFQGRNVSVGRDGVVDDKDDGMVKDTIALVAKQWMWMQSMG